MKRQDLVKIHEQTIAEISTEVVKKQQQLIDLVMKKALAQLKNVRQPKIIRQEIAQLKSIIRIKELTQSQVKPDSVKE